MKIFIEKVTNGLVVTTHTSDEVEHVVFQESEDSKPPYKDVFELLWYLINTLGAYGSRYDEERLVVKYEPGDKCDPPEGAPSNKDHMQAQVLDFIDTDCEAA